MRLAGLVVVLLLAGVAGAALAIWGIVDAAGRPDWAWSRAGENKSLWVLLQAVAIVVPGTGLIITIVYLATIRQQVAAAQALGPGAWAGSWAPPGWGPPAGPASGPYGPPPGPYGGPHP